MVSVLKGWKFGDFELSDGLWNAYAEITGAPLQKNNYTPPPTYETVILNAPTNATDSRRPEDDYYQIREYGYMDYSEAPSTTTAVVHPGRSVDVYEQKISERTCYDYNEIKVPTKKVIKPMDDLGQHREYANFESNDNEGTYNYGYAYTPQNESPESQHELAVQELGSNSNGARNKATNTRQDEKNSTPGQGYQYGYISNYNEIAFHNNSQPSSQCVSESFI